MFGWFATKSPLGTYEKTWTENRMRWLAGQLGIDRLLQAEVVLPTEEYFPGQLGGRVEDAPLLLERVGGYLGVEIGYIELQICSDEQLPGAAGHYYRGERTIIRVAESQLDEPIQLIATLAHELAHEILLGGGLVDADVEDHEWLTDLLPVFLGMGIFAANSTVQETYESSARSHSWSIGKQGYLPARTFGYAFALFAFVRKEEHPAWARHLRLDASSTMLQGLRYLRKTNDSLFQPETIHAQPRSWTPHELADRVKKGTPSVRLEALWQLAEQTAAEQEVVKAVSSCLLDRDPDISRQAGKTLAAFGSSAASSIPLLLEVLREGNVPARSGAASALGGLRQQPDIVIPELCILLDEDNPQLVTEATQALCRFGTQAARAAPKLLGLLTTSLIKCKHERIKRFVRALIAVTPDPKQTISDYFAERDRELLREALRAFEEQHD